MVAQIPLTKGYFTLVDDEDVAFVNQYSWWARETGRGLVYASCSKMGRRFQLHDLILPPGEGLVVDHINRDALDNRRCNLRLATRHQNLLNRQHPTSGKYRGARKHRNKWRAVCWFNGVCHRVHGFATEVEAARAYDRLARELHGEFAVLNFPEDA